MQEVQGSNPRLTEQATDKTTPSLWRGRHSAIDGLRPPEHHAGNISSGLYKDPSESNTNKTNNRMYTSVCAPLRQPGLLLSCSNPVVMRVSEGRQFPQHALTRSSCKYSKHALVDHHQQDPHMAVHGELSYGMLLVIPVSVKKHSSRK